MTGPFKQASTEGKILFLDEADSFFMNRETSSEHYVAETNELLTQMENFKGILVCATNFSTSMDQASMRRFNYKIKFDYLNNEGKLNMFKFQFGKFLTGELTREIEERVMALKYLTRERPAKLANSSWVTIISFRWPLIKLPISLVFLIKNSFSIVLTPVYFYGKNERNTMFCILQLTLLNRRLALSRFSVTVNFKRACRQRWDQKMTAP